MEIFIKKSKDTIAIAKVNSNQKNAGGLKGDGRLENLRTTKKRTQLNRREFYVNVL